MWAYTEKGAKHVIDALNSLHLVSLHHCNHICFVSQ